MRKTRFMSLLFLMWSSAFFLVPEFRQSFQAIFAGQSLSSSSGGVIGTLPHRKMEELTRAAEEQHDAGTLAFVAMHAAHGPESLRLANEAVQLDPQLKWIYMQVFFNLRYPERYDAELKEILARLKEAEPDNAFPLLLEGGEIMGNRKNPFPMPPKYDEMAKETAWRQVMGRAFTAPRYDSHISRLFEFDRVWLRQHGLDRPATMSLLVAGYPIPNLLNIRIYADLLVKKFGKDAEQARRVAEALRHYWTVAHMGERMQLGTRSTIEKLIGAALQRQAYESLIPLLRKTGREEEAVTLEYLHKELVERQDILRGKDPLAQSTNYTWASLMVTFFAGLVLVFGLATATCVVYVNAKRWIRREKKGRLYEALTVAENYMPILLFIACAGLYFTYFPYARNFHYYMTASGEVHDLEPLFFNTLPTFQLIAAPGTLPLGNPFTPYLWYALAGLGIGVISQLAGGRRGTPDKDPRDFKSPP